MKAYIVSGAVLLTGCAIAPPTEVPISAPFSKSEVAWFERAGESKVEGSAFLRTKGGAVKTCAGYEVQLFPYSAYAAERVSFIYGNETSGHLFGPRHAWKFIPDDPEYYKVNKQTVCNSKGEFEFENLPAGEYFIIAQVTWDIGKVFDEGGLLMKKVTTANGGVKKVTLTAN